MIYQSIIDVILDWLKQNYGNIILVAIVIIIGWIFIIIFSKQINRLRKLEKLEEQTARNLKKLIKVLVVLIILSTILIQFVEALGLVTSLFTLVGGTILGFAAISTVGNAIAGIIIMISRPFTPGDFIIHHDKMAKVEDIKLIYTILIDYDGVRISVPNQRILSEETHTLAKKSRIRRRISITADFKEDKTKVRAALLEAADSIELILKDPKPFVRITNFLNFAIEYTLFVYVTDIKSIPKMEGQLREKIFDTVNRYNIDISTPSLYKKL